MREIKLKLWDKKNKKWYSDIWFLGFDGHLYGLKNRMLVTLNDDDYEKVMFTGLHDKNGKEIYENDYLYHETGYPAGRVVFDNGSFRGKWEGCKHSGQILNERLTRHFLIKDK